MGDLYVPNINPPDPASIGSGTGPDSRFQPVEDKVNLLAPTFSGVSSSSSRTIRNNNADIPQTFRVYFSASHEPTSADFLDEEDWTTSPQSYMAVTRGYYAVSVVINGQESPISTPVFTTNSE